MDAYRMDALVTATEGRIRRAWLALIEHIRDENSEAEIAARIGAGSFDVLTGIPQAAARAAIGFHAAYIAAGQATARWLDGQLRNIAAVGKSLPVFDSTAPPAAQWAAQNRLDLIAEIETETRMLIRDILMEGARTGANPLAVARELRESVGLTSYQRGIVDNYRRELVSGRYADALARELSSGHSDRAIEAAMRAGRSMTTAQIETAVERYRDNFVAMRARTIARTEGLRVAHQGSEELYRQAVERGDIEAEQIERTWHHAGHAATSARGGKSKGRGDRPYHVSMDGQTRAFGEMFVSGIGGLLRHPGDPEASAEETANCRCVLTTRVRPSASAQQGGGRPGAGGGGGGDEEIAVADEAAAEEEAAALEEEQAAAMAEAEQAALEEEFASAELESSGDPVPEEIAPDVSPADIADLLGDEVPTDLDQVDGLSRGHPQDQQLQQAQHRLAARRAEFEAARAELSRLELEHAAAERDVAGFRIGSARIAGETEIDESSWLTDQRAEMERARPPSERATQTEVLDTQRAWETGGDARGEIYGDPYRTPGVTGDQLLESDKPAPVGFESVEYNGELYYRHRITGRSYTPAQFAERSDPSYTLELTGPNLKTVPQYEGFEALEVKARSDPNPELRYRSKRTGWAYTAAEMTDGYMAGAEEVLTVEAKKPGLLRRMFDRMFRLSPNFD